MHRNAAELLQPRPDPCFRGSHRFLRGGMAVYVPGARAGWPAAGVDGARLPGERPCRDRECQCGWRLLPNRGEHEVTEANAVAGAAKQVTVHGEACLDCHLAPTNPAIPKFDFGGRVFDAQGKPASRVEVRLTNTTSGHPISAYSNDDGYFWWPPPSSVSDDPYGGGFFAPPVDHVQFPSATGARSEKGVKVTMCASAPHGNCGTCHKDKSAPIVVKP